MKKSFGAEMDSGFAETREGPPKQGPNVPMSGWVSTEWGAHGQRSMVWGQILSLSRSKELGLCGVDLEMDRVII